MIGTYIKLALRNLLRNKLTTFTSIIGLAVALATAFLISIFISYEFSYDSGFADADQIMRVYATTVDPNGDVSKYCSIPAGIAPAMVEEIPEVISEFRILIDDDDKGNFFTYNDKTYKLKGYPNATSSILDVLGLDLITGNFDSLQSGRSRTLISQEHAKLFFGDQNPVGKALKTGNDELQIDGVFQTINWPSHFPEFAFIGVSDNWFNNLPKWKVPFTTSYVKIAEGSNLDSVQAKIDALVQRNIGEELNKSGKKYFVGLEPIRDIHLYSELTTRWFSSKSRTERAIIDIKRFLLVGLIVLLVAMLNFINLQTAILPRYSKQFGIIKVLGASHFQVARTKIAETVIINFISLLIAAAMSYLLLPIVTKVLGSELNIIGSQLLVVVLMISVLVLIAGLLISLAINQVLTRIRMTDIIKGQLLQGTNNEKLRSMFVILQMSTLIVLILLTTIIQNQMDFMLNSQRGFDDSDVIILNIPYIDDFNVRPLQDELNSLSSVKNSSGCSFLPFYGWASSTIVNPNSGDDTRHEIKKLRFDDNMLDVLGIELLDGRNFTAEEIKVTDVLLINEAGVKFLNLKDPVGLEVPHCQIETGEIFATKKIVGVVKDFNLESLRLPIQPLMISPSDQDPFFVVVKLNNGDIDTAIEQISILWKEHFPNHFLEYDILSDKISLAYSSDIRIANLFKITTFVAIIIGMFGIFALTTSEVERRIKEVGIRKVLGATGSNIVTLFASKYFKLIAVSLLVALPLAFLMIQNWLNNYAFKVKIDPLLFITSVMLIMIVFLLSIIAQTWRAANINPVSTIRNE